MTACEKEKMMIKNILFDLDGTLLAQNQEFFLHSYFQKLGAYAKKLGFEEEVFMKGLGKGVKAMLLNDGTQKNIDAFWDTFTLFTEIDRDDVETHFEHFYKTVFDAIGDDVIPYEGLLECLKRLKEKRYCLILATNPLFPPIATHNRIRWAGLSPELFDHITTYDNAKYSKPNIKYFQEILDKLELKKEECLMIGNDLTDDFEITKLEVPLYIVTDHLINEKNRELPKLHSNMEDLITYLDHLPKINM